MGNGFSSTCENCGYELSAFLGYGMMYPIVYEEMLRKLAKGRFGHDATEFYFTHKNVGVDFETKLYHCEKCNRYTAQPCLDMYLLKKSPRKDWTGWSSLSKGEHECFIAPDDEENWPADRKHIHKCYICKREMQEVDVDKLTEQLYNGEFKCPKCGGKMGMTVDILWD